MTNGQVQRLQDLSKCYMKRHQTTFVKFQLMWDDDAPMNKYEKAELRSLTHQYRHQIRAIRRNQRADD